MKKKAIEKIPYQTVEKVAEKYTHVVAVFTREICGISHLFVELYKNKKGSLTVPYMRAVFTEHDWGLYFPNNKIWSAAAPREMYCYEDKTYISEKNTKMIWNTVEKTRPFDKKYPCWVSRLVRLTSKIEDERRIKAMEKRERRLQDRILNVPEEPADLKDYVEGLFNHEHRLYYKRKGRYADVYCTACGGDCTKAIKQGESFEAQFESTIPVPKEGQTGICPLCGATGIYKAKGRWIQIKSPEQLTRYFFVAQQYKGDGAVLRYYEAVKEFDLVENEHVQAKEQTTIIEISREFFEKGKKPQKDFHVYDSWNGKNRWIDCNIQGNNSIGISPGRIYPGSYVNLKETCLRYSEAEEYAKRHFRYNLFKYIETYLKFPQIELFSKAGLYGIVEGLVNRSEDLNINPLATKLKDFFKIYPERVSDLIRQKGDVQYLKVYQKEKELDSRLKAHRSSHKNLNQKEKGLRFTKRQIDAIKACQLADHLSVEFLEYTGLDRLINNIERYAGCEAVADICSSAELHLEAVTRRYFDYINMRVQQGYDLHNSIYLFPRDLNTAHEEMTEEVNKEKIEKRNKEITLKYPDIAKNYRKLCYRYSYKTEKYLIRPARSAIEIVREGRVLHHCVGGDNYLSGHNNGKSYILFLRKKDNPEEPYITIEIRGNEIVQWYGAYDKKPNKKFIDGLLKKYTKEVEERLKRPTMAAAV